MNDGDLEKIRLVVREEVRAALAKQPKAGSELDDNIDKLKNLTHVIKDLANTSKNTSDADLQKLKDMMAGVSF